MLFFALGVVSANIYTQIGLLGLLAASGPGANSRFAISFVLGVGLTIGTLFTLFVVPALYTVIASEHGSGRDREAAA